MILIRILHRVYKLMVSPIMGNICRFEPSCSDYCVSAMEKHGFLKGVLLGIRRVVRCNPYCAGGLDPVP